MKKGLMLALALTVVCMGTAQADDQALLDKVNKLESKVERLEGKANLPASTPAPMGAGSYVNNSDGITLGGYVSSGYNLNWLSPNPDNTGSQANGNNTNVRAFDRDSNSFLNNAKLVLEKPVTEASTAGFRADLMFGRDAQILSAATNGEANNRTCTSFTDGDDNEQNICSGGNANTVFVEQAYVHYIAPIGNGVDLKVGRFVTIAGAEVIESKDNWNSSRGLLFQNAIPYTHNGILASYKINDLVDVKLGLANGWDSEIDNNKSKTVLAQVNLHPIKGVDITQNYIGGPEQGRNQGSTTGLTGPNAGNAPERHMRQLLDTVIMWQPLSDNAAWKVLANFDLGWEEKAASIEGVSKWEGVSLGTKYDVNNWLTLAGRWEYFNDNDGTRIGNLNGITGNVGCNISPRSQTSCNQPTVERDNLLSMTYTADVKLAKNLITRLEWRYDWATDPIFDLSNNLGNANNSTYVGASNSQHTVGAEVIYVFG